MFITTTSRIDNPQTSPNVVVTAVHEERPGADALEVHRRSGSRAPVPGETLGTWCDVSTLYAVAPRDESREVELPSVHWQKPAGAVIAIDGARLRIVRAPENRPSRGVARVFARVESI